MECARQWLLCCGRYQCRGGVCNTAGVFVVDVTSALDEISVRGVCFRTVECKIH